MKIEITRGNVKHSVEFEQQNGFGSSRSSQVTELVDFFDAVLRRMFPGEMRGRQIRYARSNDGQEETSSAVMSVGAYNNSFSTPEPSNRRTDQYYGHAIQTVRPVVDEELS